MELKEYRQRPKWIDSLTDTDRYEWYLFAKKNLSDMKRRGDCSALEQAILEYEKKNGII